MGEIDCRVLTEQLQRQLRGRRLVYAVFTTYTFDPEFLEQDVLPALFDEALSHVAKVRLLQVEDLLEAMPGGVSVYYDAANLTLGGPNVGRLDVRRIPVRHRSGAFHPKTVFLLVEEPQPDEEGHHPQALIVAGMSANLTRSGWWSNIEVAHIEEIGEGQQTRLRDSLRAFLMNVRRSVGERADHSNLDAIREFLRGTVQRSHRSLSGVLLPHFYDGSQTFPDFLEEIAGNALADCHLEVISPYFDADTCKPLQELIARFRPKGIRVFLPRSEKGEALCSEAFFRDISGIAGLEWGVFPPAMMNMGRGDAVAQRFVHAKVYRFFSKRPAREFCFVGSVNLTTAAHQRRNVETGFLVQVDVHKQPDFWLIAEDVDARAFAPMTEDAEEGRWTSLPLDIRYHWDRSQGEAYWDSDLPAPDMRLASRGVELGRVPSLASRQWTRLGSTLEERLEQSLRESSILDVLRDDSDPVPILVQEEGMSHKPSLLHLLTAAEILKYWALLTPEQRTAFIANRTSVAGDEGPGTDLVIPFAKYVEDTTLFDRFAGIFHAFGCLERFVCEALDAGQEKAAIFRVFGKKYDSLGSLMDKLVAEGQREDASVETYVTFLCAQQLLDTLARRYPDFARRHKRDVNGLRRQMDSLASVRARLVRAGGPEIAAFLDWFDPRFLQRSDVAVRGGNS